MECLAIPFECIIMCYPKVNKQKQPNLLNHITNHCRQSMSKMDILVWKSCKYHWNIKATSRGYKGKRNNRLDGRLYCQTMTIMSSMITCNRWFQYINGKWDIMLIMQLHLSQLTRPFSDATWNYSSYQYILYRVTQIKSYWGIIGFNPEASNLNKEAPNQGLAPFVMIYDNTKNIKIKNIFFILKCSGGGKKKQS